MNLAAYPYPATPAERAVALVLLQGAELVVGAALLVAIVAAIARRWWWASLALSVAWALGLLGVLVLKRLVDHQVVEQDDRWTLTVMAITYLVVTLLTVAWRRHRPIRRA